MWPSTLHVLPYAGVAPRCATPPRYAGVGAAVLGRVTLGADAWLGSASVVRADGEVVVAGEAFHLGDHATLHIVHDELSCRVGDRVAVGHHACVHACTVGSDVVVGAGSVILDGAVVEDGVVFEPDATVFPGKHVAGGFLYAGSPAKALRALRAGEIAERREALIEEHRRREGQLVATVAAAGAFEAEAALASDVFVASTARLRGRIEAGPSSSIFFSNVVDAGAARVTIGARTNIQDNTMLRCGATGVTIGSGTTVGHNVTLADCRIGNRALVGIGAIVAPGTVIEDWVLLAAHARTEPGQVLASGWVWGGRPARRLGRLDAAKARVIDANAAIYVGYARDYKAAEASPLTAGG
jgi:carbonic anhydrase/acetyltransferase-like protein (isoleucine patch superfamily)